MMPPKLTSFASRIGLTGLAIAVLIALLAVQTVRLEGLKIWPLNIEGARPKAERLQGVIDDIDKAQERALAKAELAKAKAEADYRNLAERIDDEAEEARAGALAGADEYIRTHRVQCAANRGSGGGTATASEDRSARDSETDGRAPELDGLVAVPESDIRICTTNTLQAEAAREWALGLEAAPR